MATRPPTATRILIAVGFALSCFGLALFLWIAFGGPVPLKPESYRIEVPFEEATQLATESDVRISGVSVGKVKSIELSEAGSDANAQIELDPAYAPIPEDTQAQLRQKTLLGETYVELTPGDNGGEMLEEGGALPKAQVADSVQLDEIFRAFDEPTRAAFRAWMQGQASSLRGRGDDLVAGDRQPRPLRRGGRPGAAATRQPAARRAAVHPRRRRGLRSALGAPGPAPRPDRPLERGLRDHRQPQRRAGGDIQDLPRLRARIPPDADPTLGVRAEHRPADPATAARRPASSARP